MTPTLYITRNGLLEPLGQSQVFSYLKGLSQDYQITLITFEKPEDLINIQAVAKAKKDCDTYGIEWHFKKFRRQPKFLAPFWSLFEMFWAAYNVSKNGNVKLIHARSYMPAAAAWAVNRLTGTPFIFDMRALWPEELIVAGRLKRGSVMHKILTNLEKVCLRDAAVVVSLTNAAVKYLCCMYPNEIHKQRITVIPTCADLERFKPSDKQTNNRVYGCVGTLLSGWFLRDWLSTFFNVVAKKDPEAKFEIITRDDASMVRVALDVNGKLGSRLSIFSCKPENIHEKLQEHSTSAMFFTTGKSKLGSAPTRLAEALGCSLPVIANEGVGDVAEIIRHYNVGVIVKNGSDEAMKIAFSELEILCSDPNLPARCRKAAEKVFSLHAGTQAYRKVYSQIVAPSD
jgi:glycosyltransferase involved in cell wall biosynthesis